MITDKNKDYDSETYTIPTDVMVEIAQIILQADLPHEIIAVKENKAQIVFSISHQSNLKFHQEAIKNIAEILREYQILCGVETENDTHWRENKSKE
ncbi:MAG TPA: hypothetical protein VF411_11615 [Bacteroidia bacterium]